MKKMMMIAMVMMAVGSANAEHWHGSERCLYSPDSACRVYQVETEPTVVFVSTPLAPSSGGSTSQIAVRSFSANRSTSVSRDYNLAVNGYSGGQMTQADLAVAETVHQHDLEDREMTLQEQQAMWRAQERAQEQALRVQREYERAQERAREQALREQESRARRHQEWVRVGTRAFEDTSDTAGGLAVLGSFLKNK